MRIVALSDLHGILPEVPAGDVCIIAGDVCPIWNHDLNVQMNWLLGPFTDWLNGIKAERIIMVAGNHDFIFEKGAKVDGYDVAWLKSDLPVTFLEDDFCIHRGVKFYGFPWVINLPSWAFNLYSWDMQDKVDAIPDDTDVLITHGPPAGIMDISSPKYGSVSCGCPALRSALSHRLKPKVHIWGHIHESHGVAVGGDGLIDTAFYNVAILDDNYENVYPVTEIDI